MRRPSWTRRSTAARREAKAAFGDDRVFCERYVERPRHVEIQLLADGTGRSSRSASASARSSVATRKCWRNRRPSSRDLRGRMSEAALAFARAIGYRSAGTAEFMLDGDDFYFLELNGRIQVEHPGTEAVTGIDLVQEQIRIAQGEHIDHVAPAIEGHAVEVRLYAEDPETFFPQTGRIERLRLPETIRVDAGVAEGDEVGVGYDSMIAKLIADGATREEAFERLRRRSTRPRSRASSPTCPSCAGSCGTRSCAPARRRRLS